MASNHTATNQVDTNKQLAENTLASINDASTAGRALYTGFLALTAYIIVALGTTDDLQLFDRAPLTLPLLNVEISLTGFYRYTPWLYVIVHANLLLLFSMIAEKHRYFAELVDRCAWPDRVHMRQQLHVNAFTQFLGADHSGLLAVILKLMIWFTVGLMPPMLLLAIQLDFLAAQVESVTNLQQTAVLVDGFFAGFFWNNILQNKHRSLFPKEWNPPFWKRYLLEGWVLWISVLLIIGFSWMIALVPLSDYERFVHNKLMPEWLGLAENNCVLDEDLERLRAKINYWNKFSGDSIELEEKLKKLENEFNRQLVNPFTVTTATIVWATPYRCSNWLTWWFIDRSDTWLNEKLEIRRWLNLPDKVFVENRNTVQPQRLNRLKSELAYNTVDAKASNPSSDKNTSKITNIDKPASFKTLDYFLPVNKENQHFNFANFNRSFFPNAKMKQTELQIADLSYAQLQSADLSMANLRRTNLMSAHLQGANLTKARLQGAFLAMADLRGAILEGALLQDAMLIFTKLQGADLSKAQLQGANFMSTSLLGANLRGAELQGANLSGTNLYNTIIYFPSQLQGADLTGAEMQGADLSGADLQGADLREAQLQNILMFQTILTGVQFSDSSLDNALTFISTDRLERD